MMSLLSQLQNKKKDLKRTSTKITNPDGSQYIENYNGQILKINSHNPGFIIDTKPDFIPAEIIPYVYLGSQDCCDISVLEKYVIKNVLSIGILPFTKHPNVQYKFIECLDLPETNLRNAIEYCILFIENCINKKENILLHCNAGCSRSPSITIGYLILKQNYNFQTAYDLVKRARPCIQPNPEFVQQLKSL